MIYVGIDVAKDKHKCFITDSDGAVSFKPFTIQNNRQGFDELYQRIISVSRDLTKVKVGLEANNQSPMGSLFHPCFLPPFRFHILTTE